MGCCVSVCSDIFLFVFPESIALCRSPNENIGSSMKMPTHSIITASKKCGDGRLHGHLDDIRLAILQTHLQNLLSRSPKTSTSQCLNEASHLAVEVDNHVIFPVVESMGQWRARQEGQQQRAYKISRHAWHFSYKPDFKTASYVIMSSVPKTSPGAEASPIDYDSFEGNRGRKRG